MSTNDDLAELFSNAAAVLDILGGNSFKAIAFSKVSRILSDMTEDIRLVHAQGRLGEIPGIGASSQKIIEEFLTTGRSSDVDELLSHVPSGLLELLRIPGMGPKTVALLWKERGITSIDELTQAIEQGKLAGLKGIGTKKIESIKQGLAMRQSAAERIGIAPALEQARAMVARLRRVRGVKEVEIAGSLRRGRETVGDVDLICAIEPGVDPNSVTAAFAGFELVQRVMGQGATKASIVTKAGLQVDLRVVPPLHFGATLLYFTGSKDHNVRIRGRAQDRGMTLNEWGLYDLETYDKSEKKPGEPPPVKPLASRTEHEIYHALELAWIPPELREDRGEVDLAEKNALPVLVTRADIKGDLHTHTTASDGHNSIEEMAQAAIEMGYEYLAITDHSRSQAIANGLSVERLLEHIKAIRKASDRIKGITLLAGAEVDILVDGRLDYEDEILKELDWVVASPHVSLKQEMGKATDRIVKAIENRYVHVIGHPTGRLINARAGLPLDFARIYAAAKQTGTALEINASYPRLDLNDVHARGALEAGVMLSMNTDSHSIGELDQIDLGLTVARRAGATAKQILNSLGTDELLKWCRSKR